MHTYQHNPTMASGGSGSGHERAPVISDEDAHRMLGPFVMMVRVRVRDAFEEACMAYVFALRAVSDIPSKPPPPPQGLLKPSQIDAALKRPLRERETALQVLMGQGLQLRQDQRKVRMGIL